MKIKKTPRRRIRAVKLAIAVTACLLALLIAYQGGRWFETRQHQPEKRGDPNLRYAYEDTLVMEGVTYRLRPDVTTILLMGVDQNSDDRSAGYRSGGQADFLRLLVVDNAAKTVRQLEIDRDTMTEITTVGVLGNVSGTRVAQICLSHSFGEGGLQSAALTRDAVSGLLMDLDIDYYVALNMDGISALNDWVGGVEVTLEDDFSVSDPAMTKGTTLKLTGDQAEIFVRSRRNVGDGTNESRMVRQRLYVDKLNGQIMERLSQGKTEIEQMYDTLRPYLATNMVRAQLINEIWAAKDYTATSVTIPGAHTVGEDGFMQFYPDVDDLEQLVLELAYEPIL